MNWMHKNRCFFSLEKKPDVIDHMSKNQSLQFGKSQDLIHLPNYVGKKNNKVTIHQNLKRGIKEKIIVPGATLRPRDTSYSVRSPPPSPTNTIPFESPNQSQELYDNSDSFKWKTQHRKQKYSELMSNNFSCDNCKTVSIESESPPSSRFQTPENSTNFYFYDGISSLSDKKKCKISPERKRSRMLGYKTNWSHSPNYWNYSSSKEPCLMMSAKSESPLSKWKKYSDNALRNSAKRNKILKPQPNMFVHEWICRLPQPNTSTSQLIPPSGLKSKTKRNSTPYDKLRKVSMSPSWPRTPAVMSHCNQVECEKSDTPENNPRISFQNSTLTPMMNKSLTCETLHNKNNNRDLSKSTSQLCSTSELKHDKNENPSHKCECQPNRASTIVSDHKIQNVTSLNEKHDMPESSKSFNETTVQLHKKIELLKESIKINQERYNASSENSLNVIKSATASNENVCQPSDCLPKTLEERRDQEKLPRVPQPPEEYEQINISLDDSFDVTYLKSEFCVQCKPSTKEAVTQTDSIIISHELLLENLLPISKVSVETFINNFLSNHLKTSESSNNQVVQRDLLIVLDECDRTKSCDKL